MFPNIYRTQPLCPMPHVIAAPRRSPPQSERVEQLSEEVYELKVLELGGQSGGELGAIAGLAHAARNLQKRLHGAGERHVPAPQGYYRALYLRAVLDLYQREMPRRYRTHH